MTPLSLWRAQHAGYYSGSMARPFLRKMHNWRVSVNKQAALWPELLVSRLHQSEPADYENDQHGKGEFDCHTDKKFSLR